MRALDDLGFKIFSAGKETRFNMENYSFSFIPISISFNIPTSYNNRFTTNLNISIKQFRLLKDSLPFIGIYLHHDMFNQQDFKNLILFIHYLIKEDVEFCKLGDIGDEK